MKTNKLSGGVIAFFISTNGQPTKKELTEMAEVIRVAITEKYGNSQQTVQIDESELNGDDRALITVMNYIRRHTGRTSFTKSVFANSYQWALDMSKTQTSESEKAKDFIDAARTLAREGNISIGEKLLKQYSMGSMDFRNLKEIVKQIDNLSTLGVSVTFNVQ